MILSTATLVLHAVTAGLIALLVVSPIVGILVLIQRWHRFSRERREAIRRWTFTVGIGALAFFSWGELVDGSPDLLPAFFCLYFTIIFANYLRYRPKPGRWEQEVPATEPPSPWEMAGARYRLGAVVLIALTLTAGVGMLALRALATL